MEHVVSDERLQRIIGRAYEAGEAGAERYTQLLADGPEVVLCRDCAKSRESGWRCTRFVEESYDEAQEVGEIVMASVRPDGFCAWAERAGAKEAV